MKQFLIFLLFTSFSWSQTENIVLTKDSDTIYWKNYIVQELKEFNLNGIKSNDGYSFRLSTYGSMVEIQNNDNIYSGSVTYFVQEVDDSRDDKRTYKKSYILETSIIQKLFSLIDSSKVNKIPSDKFIKGWEHGLDGITYFFESKNESEYSFKTYWTPNFQNISEAISIQNFIDNYYKIIDIEKYASAFRKEVPFKSYSYDGGSRVVITPLTRKEYKEYLKRKRKKKRDTN